MPRYSWPSLFGATSTAPPPSPSVAPTEHDDELYDTDLTADILAASRAKDALRARLKGLLTKHVENVTSHDRDHRAMCRGMLQSRMHMRAGAIGNARDVLAMCRAMATEDAEPHDEAWQADLSSRCWTCLLYTSPSPRDS